MPYYGPGYGGYQPHGPHRETIPAHFYPKGFVAREESRTCGCCPSSGKGKFWCLFCLAAVVGIALGVSLGLKLKGHSHTPSGVHYVPGSSTPTTIPGSPAPAPAPAPAPSGPSVAYKTFSGDGSTAQGWPSADQWVSFETMWSANTKALEAGCQTWGVADNTSSEISELESVIRSVAAVAGIDPRFVLAVVMQESKGCVRVITTNGAVNNPGLMQSHNGPGSCNTQGQVQDPVSDILGVAYSWGVFRSSSGRPQIRNADSEFFQCPESEIRQMVSDGVQGTPSGDGLVQAMSEAGTNGAQQYYRAARIYNSGSIIGDGVLSVGGSTSTYCSDIANRLLGWAN